MAYNLKWRRANAPYAVIAIVPIGEEFLNVRIRGTQFQVKSFQGAWYALFIIGDDTAPQTAIGPADDPSLDGNYQIVDTNCLQLKNFDTGSFFTILGVLTPPVVGWLTVGELYDNNNSRDTSTTPTTYTIYSIEPATYCAPWIYDDGAGGLSVTLVCPESPITCYVASNTTWRASSTAVLASFTCQ